LNSEETLPRELKRHVRKNVHELNSAFGDILDRADSEAVHEFRKRTRQLQTIVDFCDPRVSPGVTKKLRKRLQECRHALSEWRDTDVLLDELAKARKAQKAPAEKQRWLLVQETTERQNRRAKKQFRKIHKALKVKATGRNVLAIAKKTARSKSIVDGLRQLLEHTWRKWCKTIDDFERDPSATLLHAVRIKAKGLRYAIELNQQFYPDEQLDKAGEWLKEIQDRVGAWHDELTLSQYALQTFSQRYPRDRSAIRVILQIKQKELSMADAARDFVSSIRETDDFRRLRRRLAASVFALGKGKHFDKDDINRDSGPDPTSIIG
jgi:CHAD domain-containing protein